MISKLRTAFMIRSRLKNKANNSDKVANKIAYKKQRTLDVKLNKEAKTSFSKTNSRKSYK